MQMDQGIYPIERTRAADSPLLITTNFSLTYFTVAGEIEASKVPTWLLVMDTEGQSVLTSWAAGKFVADAIATFVKKSGIEEKVSHRKIIIPGYVAQISGELEEELGGWEVVVGVREAADVPKYLRAAGCERSSNGTAEPEGRLAEQLIISKQKPFEEILESLSRDDTNVYIVGCGECATVTQTGGETELAEMKTRLEAAGKTIVATDVAHSTCHELDIKRIFRQNKEAAAAADAFLVLSCGAGAQSVREATTKHVSPGDRLAVRGQRQACRWSSKRNARCAASASSTSTAPSARSPAAPRASSTVPAAAPTTASARWTPRRTAPGC